MVIVSPKLLLYGVNRLEMTSNDSVRESIIKLCLVFFG